MAIYNGELTKKQNNKHFTKEEQWIADYASKNFYLDDLLDDQENYRWLMDHLQQDPKGLDNYLGLIARAKVLNKDPYKYGILDRLKASHENGTSPLVGLMNFALPAAVVAGAITNPVGTAAAILGGSALNKVGDKVVQGVNKIRQLDGVDTSLEPQTFLEFWKRGTGMSDFMAGLTNPAYIIGGLGAGGLKMTTPEGLTRIVPSEAPNLLRLTSGKPTLPAAAPRRSLPIHPVTAAPEVSNMMDVEPFNWDVPTQEIIRSNWETNAHDTPPTELGNNERIRQWATQYNRAERRGDQSTMDAITSAVTPAMQAANITDIPGTLHRLGISANISSNTGNPRSQLMRIFRVVHSNSDGSFDGYVNPTIYDPKGNTITPNSGIAFEFRPFDDSTIGMMRLLDSNNELIGDDFMIDLSELPTADINYRYYPNHRNYGTTIIAGSGGNPGIENILMEKARPSVRVPAGSLPHDFEPIYDMPKIKLALLDLQFMGKDMYDPLSKKISTRTPLGTYSAPYEYDYDFWLKELAKSVLLGKASLTDAELSDSLVADLVTALFKGERSWSNQYRWPDLPSIGSLPLTDPAHNQLFLKQLAERFNVPYDPAKKTIWEYPELVSKVNKKNIRLNRESSILGFGTILELNDDKPLPDNYVLLVDGHYVPGSSNLPASVQHIIANNSAIMKPILEKMRAIEENGPAGSVLTETNTSTESFRLLLRRLLLSMGKEDSHWSLTTDEYGIPVMRQFNDIKYGDSFNGYDAVNMVLGKGIHGRRGTSTLADRLITRKTDPYTQSSETAIRQALEKYKKDVQRGVNTLNVNYLKDTDALHYWTGEIDGAPGLDMEHLAQIVAQADAEGIPIDIALELESAIPGKGGIRSTVAPLPLYILAKTKEFMGNPKEPVPLSYTDILKALDFYSDIDNRLINVRNTLEKEISRLTPEQLKAHAKEIQMLRESIGVIDDAGNVYRPDISFRRKNGGKLNYLKFF